MDDAAWFRIAAMDIPGVDIGNVKSCTDASMKFLSDAAVAKAKSLQVSEGYEVGTVQLKDSTGTPFYDYGNGRFYNEDKASEQSPVATKDRAGSVDADLSVVKHYSGASAEICLQ